MDSTKETKQTHKSVLRESLANSKDKQTRVTPKIRQKRISHALYKGINFYISARTLEAYQNPPPKGFTAQEKAKKKEKKTTTSEKKTKANPTNPATKEATTSKAKSAKKTN